MVVSHVGLYWNSFKYTFVPNLKFLVAGLVGRANMHHCTKFHQSRPNGCGDIALTVFRMAVAAILDF